MAKQPAKDRTSDYFRKSLETPPRDQRLQYLNRKLRGIIRYAYGHSSAIRDKVDSA